MFSSRERGEGAAAIAELKVHPSSNYLCQGCASLTLSPRPEPSITPSAAGGCADGSSHLHAQPGRASPLRSEVGSVVWAPWHRPPAQIPSPALWHRPPARIPSPALLNAAHGVWRDPWQRQSWLSVPSHPSQNRQPLSRGEARREERKGT